MKTDTETIIADLRHMADENWLPTLLTQAADRLEELEKALRYLLTVSDPLFSYGVKELQAARARARKALRMDK